MTKVVLKNTSLHFLISLKMFTIPGRIRGKYINFVISVHSGVESIKIDDVILFINNRTHMSTWDL